MRLPSLAALPLCAAAAQAQTQTPPSAAMPAESTPATTNRAASDGDGLRQDFARGMAGDEQRFALSLAAVERRLAADPQDAEALVWRGSAGVFRSGQAFRAGDFARGAEIMQKGLADMDAAVALAGRDVRVLLRRGGTLLALSRQYPYPEESTDSRGWSKPG